MGYRTYSDVVPFVAHGIWEANNGQVGDGGNIFAPPRYCYLSEENEGYAKFVPEINGWKFYSADELYEVPDYPNLDDCDEVGKRGRIYAASYWMKDDKKVYLINESPYEMVDEHYISLVADSKEAIEEFYNEVVVTNIPNVTLPEICDTDSVEQTL